MAPHSAPQQAVYMQSAQQQGVGSTPPAQPMLPLSFLESAPSLDSKLASFSKSSPRLAAGIADITHGRSALSPSTGSNSFSLRMGSMTHSMQGTESPVKAGGSLLSSSGSLQAALPRVVSGHKALQIAEPAASPAGIKHSPQQGDPDLPVAPANGRVNWVPSAAADIQPAVAAAGPAQKGAQSLKQQLPQQQQVTVEQLQQQLQELQLRRQAQATTSTMNPAWAAPSNAMASLLDPLLSSTVTTSHEELVRANLKRSTSGFLRSPALPSTQGGLHQQALLEHSTHVEPAGVPRNRSLGSHQLSVSSVTDEAEGDRASTGSRGLLRTMSSRRGAYPEVATGLWQQPSCNLEEQQENCITVSGPMQCTPANGVSITRCPTVGHALPSMSTISEVDSLPSASAAATSSSTHPFHTSAASPRHNNIARMVQAAPTVDGATAAGRGQSLDMQLQHAKPQGHNVVGTQPGDMMHFQQPAHYTHSRDALPSSFSSSSVRAFGLAGSGYMDTGNSFCTAQSSGARFKVRTSLQDVPIGSVPGAAAGVAMPPSLGGSKATLSSYQVHD